MGKYQLDDKGQAQVRRYHEKYSTGRTSHPKDRVKALRDKYLSKKSN